MEYSLKMAVLDHAQVQPAFEEVKRGLNWASTTNE